MSLEIITILHCFVLFFRQGYFDNPNIDIFNSIPQLFTKVSELINELFDQPEKVTERLIITVYTEKLAVSQTSIDSKNLLHLFLAVCSRSIGPIYA
jgi:hypothetical protein